MRALVVGASGQVGNVLTELLGREHVVATYSGHPIPGGVHLDLASVDATVIERTHAEVVYCCGAVTHVDRCEDDPLGVMKVNRDGPATLAAEAARRSIPFVWLSTDFIFDGVSGPYAEDDAPCPLSAYGRSKLEGERAVLAAHPGALVARTTLVYGRDPNGKNFAYSLARALANKQPMRAPVDQVTTPTWNHDLATALIGLVRVGARGVFHVCGNERMTRYEYALRVARWAKLDASLVQPVSTKDLGQRAARPLNAGMAVDKLLKTLPGLRLHSLEESLAEWLRAPDPLFAPGSR